MPWMIVEKDGQYCVHKQNADKSAGDSLHCYDNRDDALKYMKALYANMPVKERAQEAIAAFMDKLSDLFDFATVTKSESWGDEPASSYLVVEDPEKPTTWHLPVKKHGKLDHGLMGAAWAALTSTHRGQPYGGPNKEAALTKLRGYYKSEGLTPPGEEKNQIWGITFTELGQLEAGKPIDGLAAGTFMSMQGDEVTFAPDELPQYIANTTRIIESTKTDSGEVVGLPIDMDGHDHKGGAGWIVGLELDETRNVVRFLVNWTEAGMKIIKDNIRRFFSPTTDPENKTILGGSLTNWPATRDNATGQILLRPIELSQTIKEIDMEKTIKEQIADAIREAFGGKPPEPLAEPKPQVEPSFTELLNTPEAVEELGRQAQAKAAELVAYEKRKLHAVEFASRIVGGTKERPFGLPGTRPNEVVALLLSLPEKQAAAVERILDRALEGAVDFAEHGYAADGYTYKPALPELYKPILRNWLAAGKKLDEFFTANPEIGKREDFNLAEFTRKDE